MKKITRYVVLAACLGWACGCGGSDGGTLAPELAEPLTFEQWRGLPKGVKYTADTLEHLRKNDPKYRSEEAWQQFLAREVMPERVKDFSNASARR